MKGSCPGVLDAPEGGCAAAHYSDNRCVNSVRDIPLDPQDGESEVIAAQGVPDVCVLCSLTCGSLGEGYAVLSLIGPRHCYQVLLPLLLAEKASLSVLA